MVQFYTLIRGARESRYGVQRDVHVGSQGRSLGELHVLLYSVLRTSYLLKTLVIYAAWRAQVEYWPIPDTGHVWNAYRTGNNTDMTQCMHGLLAPERVRLSSLLYTSITAVTVEFNLIHLSVLRGNLHAVLHRTESG